MESLRLVCDTEIPIQQEKMESFASSFQKSLQSIKARGQETVRNQGNLMQLKASLRDAEDEFVKVLGVKTRKEAKQMVTRDSILATKARIEELRRTVQIERARRDEYAALLSQQSLDLAVFEEKVKRDSAHKDEIQEAFSWYNRVLGFQIEGGHGVKFTFSNISLKNPYEECSFTIRHQNDTYTLLTCDPHIDDTKELIQELNRTNGLFRFVRIMRDKFQEAAMLGIVDRSVVSQDTSTISVSAPVSSVSTQRSESPAKKDELQIQQRDISRLLKEVNHGMESPLKKNDTAAEEHSKKVNRGKRVKTSILSPMSASSTRRSPRFMVKK
ncbi:hypothetical protein HS088_TW19G00474 [Tripterygium wilfordii]|uniref:Kinetochore protein SPC25 n=1 Tax=Tripterygium wilfordii TaxID=458696 RepID=A0A7J7C9U8_TRIWF|nr:kinetochore protein SPC25 homolog [Tripterygium wilfordii]KAF5730872.1 hypothetical protein HS088_TW19G00474 [Tripterygium wilfordii]